MSVGVAIQHFDVLLVIRFADQPHAPLEIAMSPDEADALARALHNAAIYTDPTLARRGPL